MVPDRKIMVCILTAMLLVMMAFPAFAVSGNEAADQQNTEAVSPAEQTEQGDQAGQAERNEQTEQTGQAEDPEKAEKEDKQSDEPAGQPGHAVQTVKTDKAEQVKDPEQKEKSEKTEKSVKETGEKDETHVDETQKKEEAPAVKITKKAAASTVKAASGLPENNTKVSYTSAGSHPVKFTVTAGGYVYRGTCATLGVDNAESGTATVKRISNDSRIAKLVYYYGYKKEWWTGANSTKKATAVMGFTDKNCKENAKQCIEALIQRDRMGWTAFWNARKVGGYRMYSTDSFMKAINNIYNKTDVSKITIPDNVVFEMFHGVSSSKVQDFYVWRYREIPVVPNGYVAVEKVSGNVSITN